MYDLRITTYFIMILYFMLVIHQFIRCAHLKRELGEPQRVQCIFFLSMPAGVIRLFGIWKDEVIHQSGCVEENVRTLVTLWLSCWTDGH